MRRKWTKLEKTLRRSENFARKGDIVHGESIQCNGSLDWSLVFVLLHISDVVVITENISSLSLYTDVERQANNG